MYGRRFIHAYLSSVLSITLVLLLTGIAALLFVNARAVTDFVKEQIGFTLILAPAVQESEVGDLMRNLESKPYVKEVVYVSREKGREEMEAMLGKDFLEAFACNPLPASVELKLKAAWICADSMAVVQPALATLPQVQEVSYQERLMATVSRNMEKGVLAVGFFILLLLFISFVLINNTVRLGIYNRRFSIHTQRMVGATRAFIRRPFMGRAMLQGLVSGLLAVLLLIALLLWFQRGFPRAFGIIAPMYFVYIFAFMLLAGMLLCAAAAYFTVNRAVRLEGPALYD